MVVNHHEVEIAIAIEVARGQTTPQVQRPEIRAGLSRHVVESAVPFSPPEKGRVLVAISLAGFRLDMSIGDHQIQMAVVVEVRQDSAPAREGSAVDAETGLVRLVLEEEPASQGSS